MGSERHGFDKDGNRWACISPEDYGYIRRTEGADGDHVDCYLSRTATESAPVFVVDQVNPETGAFDEHKCLLGFQDADAAMACYLGGFSDGLASKRMGAMTQMTMDEFKRFLKEGATDLPVDDNILIAAE